MENATHLGLDVHKDTIAVAVLRSGEAEPDERTIANTPEALRALIRRGGFDHPVACYEAGPTGYETHRLLSALGVPCDVVAPTMIPRRAGARVKTDRIDARNLARLHRAGELTAIRVPTPAEEALRDLVHRAQRSVAQRDELAIELKRMMSRYDPVSVIGEIALMGLATMGLVRIPFLYRERRVDLGRMRSGPLGAVPLGMAFAVGWTPCIGPVLAGILTAAASTGTASWGAALLFIYSLGLGIPFILLALGYARAGRTFGWLRRHGRAVEWLGGAVLVLMGILMITGQWLALFTPLIRWFSTHRWPPI